jgi:hypothetical protein
MMGLLNEEENLSISDMVKKDQEMRQQNTLDIEVDLSNPSHLKKMIGEDPQMFLEKINNPQDIEGVWLIAQHADNDLEFQKMILDFLDSNKDILSQKFNIPLQRVLSGIAMLTDRVMVNTSLSVDQQKSSEVSLGSQKYGTQGGIQNGSWVPRSIEMDGQKYFFETPEELYENKKFLVKINKIRNENGLPNLEDYVKNMQQYAS